MTREVGEGVLVLIVASGIVVILALLFWAEWTGLGPGHVVCAGADGAPLFDGPVLTARAPKGNRYARDYAWTLRTAEGTVHVTGACVHLPTGAEE